MSSIGEADCQPLTDKLNESVLLEISVTRLYNYVMPVIIILGLMIFTQIGMIVVSDDLDRETASEYELLVTARDSAINSETQEVSVKLSEMEG